MQILIDVTKALGMITMCVLCILFLFAVVSTPYRKRKSQKKIQELAENIMQELAKENKKEEEPKPKKRGRKPKADKVK